MQFPWRSYLLAAAVVLEVAKGQTHDRDGERLRQFRLADLGLVNISKLKMVLRERMLQGLAVVAIFGVNRRLHNHPGRGLARRIGNLQMASQSKLINRALCRNPLGIWYSVSSRPVRGVVFVGSGPSGHAKIWATVVAVGVPFGKGTCFSAWRKS